MKESAMLAPFLSFNSQTEYYSVDLLLIAISVAMLP
jgi:hypothetical protein